MKPMKEIMAGLSTESTEGVPSMSFAPKAAKAGAQLDMFAPSPISALAKDLQATFVGQTLTVAQVFRRHHEGTNYVPKNYRDAILQMEQRGEVTCAPPASERPPRGGEPTLAEWVKVTFPASVRPGS